MYMAFYCLFISAKSREVDRIFLFFIFTISPFLSRWGHSQPHSPRWTKVPLSSFFLIFHSFLFFLKLSWFLSSLWPSGWMSWPPGKALATPPHQDVKSFSSRYVSLCLLMFHGFLFVSMMCNTHDIQSFIPLLTFSRSVRSSSRLCFFFFFNFFFSSFIKIFAVSLRIFIFFSHSNDAAIWHFMLIHISKVRCLYQVIGFFFFNFPYFIKIIFVMLLLHISPHLLVYIWSLIGSLISKDMVKK